MDYPKSEDLPLSSLDLDVSNPRFGGLSNSLQSQRLVLDKIVEEFGVDDLLSSLAVNGYFKAEPIVVRKNGEKYVVVEGNRRVAACLMLTGDSRAENQKQRAEKFVSAWKAHNSPSLNPIPAIVFPEGKIQKSLLSYLGVRHISSAKSWDSYAKAAWVARVIQDSDFSVKDVAAMIGDQHRTIERLLQGYFVVQQLTESGDFRPEDSVRRGRGSVSDYPFSWVYTVLGYSAARRYLEIEGESDVTNPKPIAQKNLRKGGVLMRAMFGDSKSGLNSALDDSRQLGQLASIVANPEKLALLEQGKRVDEIERISQPTEDQLRSGLALTRETLSQLLARIAESPVPPTMASSFLDPASKVSNLAVNLEKSLKNIAGA